MIQAAASDLVVYDAAMFATVFLTSVLGSVHCVGMCGAFMLFAVGIDKRDQRKTAREALLHSCYHIGRLITYVTLGFIAGSLGAGLDLGGSMVGLNRFAALLTGVMMITFGIAGLATAMGKRTPKMPVPKFMQNAVQKGICVASGLPAWQRALTTGMLTTLLPCGWLYAYVIVAAGSASPMLGPVTMLVFWIGTLPVMLTIGVGARKLLGLLGSKLPVIGACAMIVVGGAALFSRFDLIERAPSMYEQIQASGVTIPDAADMPCCEVAEEYVQPLPSAQVDVP